MPKTIQEIIAEIAPHVALLSPALGRQIVVSGYPHHGGIGIHVLGLDWGREACLYTFEEIVDNLYPSDMKARLDAVEVAARDVGPTSSMDVLQKLIDGAAAKYWQGRQPKPRDMTADIRFSIDALLKTRGFPQVDGPKAPCFWAGGAKGAWHSYIQYANGAIQPDGAPRMRDKSLDNVAEIITNAVRTFAILLDDREARGEPMPCAVVWRTHPEIGTEHDGPLYWRARLAFVPVADMAAISVDRPEWADPAIGDGIPPTSCAPEKATDDHDRHLEAFVKAREEREKLAARVFNSAFNVGVPPLWPTPRPGDGVALTSCAHPGSEPRLSEDSLEEVEIELPDAAVSRGFLVLFGHHLTHIQAALDLITRDHGFLEGSADRPTEMSLMCRALLVRDKLHAIIEELRTRKEGEPLARGPRDKSAAAGDRWAR